MAATGDWLLGIEIGGTKLQLGLGRADGSLHLIDRHKVDPAAGAPAILEQIRTGFDALRQRLSLSPGQVAGAGVGFGGPVDADRGIVQTSYQVEGWTSFPLADWLIASLGIPAVAVQNDADTAGLAEALLGAGAGFSPLLYLTIGSGIGGALVLDGQIYRGCGLGAVEIGHVQVPVGSGANVRMMQLEEIASGWGIAREAREAVRHRFSQGRSGWVVLERAGGDPRAITAEFVAEAAGAGDGTAAEVLDRARQALAFALRQAIALLAPRRIILGGGVSLIGENHWFAPIRRLVDAEVFPAFRGSYEIVPSALGEEVVVHGALALARDAVIASGRLRASV
jgi:glucokinase